MGDVIAIIPVRGGSKGIPGKNIMPFCGRPLLAWSIMQGGSHWLFWVFRRLEVGFLGNTGSEAAGKDDGFQFTTSRRDTCRLIDRHALRITRFHLVLLVVVIRLKPRLLDQAVAPRRLVVGLHHLSHQLR